MHPPLSAAELREPDLHRTRPPSAPTVALPVPSVKATQRPLETFPPS